MKKTVENNKLSFFNDNNEEIMCLGFIADELVWYFKNSDIIEITPDDDLYTALNYIMNQEYEFADEALRCYKTSNRLVWYSDCYYDPSKKASKDLVSYLTIEKNGENFKIKCTKPIYESMGVANRYHAIIFSSGGNGRYTKNLKTSETFQDDISINVYQKLAKEKAKKKVLI